MSAPVETHPRDHKGIFLLNTRVFLDGIRSQDPEIRSLAQVPETYYRDVNTDTVWFMGMYAPSPTSRLLALGHKDEYITALPDIHDEDVDASPFAIRGYQPNTEIVRDWKEFDQYRDYLKSIGINRVILDFIPNHTGRDHPWVTQHPDWYIHFTEDEVSLNPNFKNIAFRVETERGVIWIAHGKDPNFPHWEDTAQLDYTNPELQEAKIQELLELAEHCDGVRCDMAMLEDEETFVGKTWRGKVASRPWPGDFWKKAIATVRKKYPKFQFIAEAYWGEGKLLEQGFSHIYAKRVYEDMKNVIWYGDYSGFYGAYDYFMHDPNSSNNLVFLENHDEERALLLFGQATIPAFAIMTGFRYAQMLIHQGQLEGRRVKNPVQIKRERVEQVNQLVRFQYQILLDLKAYYQQQGVVPERIAVHHQYNSHVYAHGNFADEQGAIVVVNLSPKVACDTIEFNGSAYNVRNVFDFADMGYVAGNIIDQRPNIMDLILPPWGVQIIELEK